MHEGEGHIKVSPCQRARLTCEMRIWQMAEELAFERMKDPHLTVGPLGRCVIAILWTRLLILVLICYVCMAVAASVPLHTPLAACMPQVSMLLMLENC